MPSPAHYGATASEMNETLPHPKPLVEVFAQESLRKLRDALQTIERIATNVEAHPRMGADELRVKMEYVRDHARNALAETDRTISPES